MEDMEEGLSSASLWDVLRQEDVLQCCKANSLSLIQFLTETSRFEQLLDLVTTGLSLKQEEDDEEERRLRLVALQILLLCEEVSALQEPFFFRPEATLGKLFACLLGEVQQQQGEAEERGSSANVQLAATFASQVIIALAKGNVQKVGDYMQRHRELEAMLYKLESEAVAAVIAKLLEEDQWNHHEQTLLDEWLETSGLVRALVTKFDPSNAPAVHDHAASLLLSIVEPSSGKMSELAHMQSNGAASPRQITGLWRQLLQEENLVLLFQTMLGNIKEDDEEAVNNASSSSACKHGLSVIISLLADYNKRAPENGESPLISVTLRWLPTLLRILTSSQGKSVPTTTGLVARGLGFVRLHIIKLLECLVEVENPTVDEALFRPTVFPALLNLFLGYPWNNILHHAVTSMILSVISSSSPTRQSFTTILLKDYRLVDILLRLDNETERKKCGGTVGFLIKIARRLEEVAASRPPVKQYLNEHTGWKAFVGGSFLLLKKEQDLMLGGGPPSRNFGQETYSSEDEGDYSSANGLKFSPIFAFPDTNSFFSNSFDMLPPDDAPASIPQLDPMADLSQPFFMEDSFFSFLCS